MGRCVIIFLLLAGFHTQAKHQTLSLQKALDLKLVAARASSLGSHQGLCMRMTFKNLSKDSLIVLVEAGRRLNSLDDRMQDILIVKEELVPLCKAEEKSVTVKGYCCQANHASPNKNAPYAVNKLADSSLVTLARFLNKNIFDMSTEQHAVWAISNKNTAASVGSADDSLVVPLRRMVAGLKGEVLPWYTVISATHVYSSGVIAVIPLLLKGQMNYTNEKDNYITLRILNEKGMAVGLVKSEWLMTTAGSSYDLNLPVKGLAKGKYTIELRSPDKELVKKEFEL